MSVAAANGHHAYLTYEPGQLDASATVNVTRVFATLETTVFAKP